jgi:hypothetical protein
MSVKVFSFLKKLLAYNSCTRESIVIFRYLPMCLQYILDLSPPKDEIFIDYE